MGDSEWPSRAAGSMSVVVLGMHRSGTSAVATALRESGLYAGPPEDEHLSAGDNPLGFAELLSTADFNDRLLDELGWTWDAPAAEPLADPPQLEDYVTEGRAMIGAQPSRANGRPLLIKDPRVSLLLPWWRRILYDRMLPIIVMRPVEEVAWSLRIRNSFHPDLGVALWNAYHRHLAVGLTGLPVVLIDYVKLVEAPTQNLVALMAAIEQHTGVSDLDAARASAAIQPLLRRATNPAPDPELATSRLVSAVEAWANDPVTVRLQFAGESLPSPERWELALLDTQRRAAVAGRQQARARDQAVETLSKAEARAAERDVAAAERDAAVTERDALLSERNELAQQNAKLTGEMDALRREHAVLLNEAELFRQQVTMARAQVQRMAGSRSWRYMGPVRAAGSVVRRLLGRGTSS